MAGWSDEKFKPGLGALFLDPQKPPSKEAVGYDYRDIVWLRPSEWGGVKNSELFKENAHSDDVIQGGLSECWFLSSVAMVAAAKLAYQLFVTDADAPEGKHTVRFFKGGQWIFVDVDDRIPCLRSNKTPIYGRCHSNEESWVPILEKAYAKVHGCYEALIDGEVDYGLQDLTGGIPRELTVQDHQAEMNNGTFWESLSLQKKEGHTLLMGCAVVQDVDCHEVDIGQGMLLNHAYSLLDISDAIPGKVMMKLRNPWGSGEWTGKWSDTDTESWTPEAREALQHYLDGTDDDGVFWMEQDDFVGIVTHLYICMVPLGWHTIHRMGEWVGESAGGRVTCPTWRYNPMLQLNITEPTHMHVCLYQRDARYVDPGFEWNVYTCIGFVVYHADQDGMPKKKLRGKDVVLKAKSKEDREVSAIVDLQPGVYYVVPNTFDAGRQGKFHVMIHSQRQLDVVGMVTGPMEGEDAVINLTMQNPDLSPCAGASPEVNDLRQKLELRSRRIVELENQLRELQSTAEVPVQGTADLGELDELQRLLEEQATQARANQEQWDKQKEDLQKEKEALKSHLEAKMAEHEKELAEKDQHFEMQREMWDKDREQQIVDLQAEHVHQMEVEVKQRVASSKLRFERAIQQRDERDNLEAKERVVFESKMRFCRLISSLGHCLAQAAKFDCWLRWNLYIRALKERRIVDKMKADLTKARDNVVQQYKEEASSHGEKVQSDISELSLKLHTSNQRNNDLREVNTRLQNQIQTMQREAESLTRQVQNYKSQMARGRSLDRAGEAEADALRTELEHCRDVVAQYEQVTKLSRESYLAGATNEVLSPGSRRKTAPMSSELDTEQQARVDAIFASTSRTTGTAQMPESSPSGTASILLDRSSRISRMVKESSPRRQPVDASQKLSFKSSDGKSSLFRDL